MFDYYRVRFKVLLPERRPIAATSSPRAMSMPRTLSWVSWASWLLVGLALATSFHAGGPSSGLLFSLLHAQVLLFPFSVTLGAGYSERQTWTRPFSIALLAVGTGALALAGLWWISAILLAGTTGVAIYLYRSEASRTYYANLREEAIVRVAVEDLRARVMLPVYTGVAGSVVGIAAASWIVLRGLAEAPDPTPGPMGPNDLYAIVLASVVGAAVLGSVGKLFGEALVSWLERRPTRG